jgi:hypothetical protein
MNWRWAPNGLARWRGRSEGCWTARAHNGYDETYYVLSWTGTIMLDQQTHPPAPRFGGRHPGRRAPFAGGRSGGELEFVIFGTPRCKRVERSICQTSQPNAVQPHEFPARGLQHLRFQLDRPLVQIEHAQRTGDEDIGCGRPFR